MPGRQRPNALRRVSVDTDRDELVQGPVIANHTQCPKFCIHELAGHPDQPFQHDLQAQTLGNDGQSPN